MYSEGFNTPSDCPSSSCSQHEVRKRWDLSSLHCDLRVVFTSTLRPLTEMLPVSSLQTINSELNFSRTILARRFSSKHRQTLQCCLSLVRLG